MADITMCNGIKYPISYKCYRHNAEPGAYQSYFAKPPYKDGKCEMFWQDVVKKRTITRGAKRK